MLKTLFLSAALIAWFAQQTPALPQSTAGPSPVPSPSGAPPATPSPTPMPTATPTPPSTPTPMPVPSITPAPPATPLPPLPTPWPTATPLPTPLPLPPDAPPQILAVQVSDPVFHSGETVSGTVITSTNVAAVELRVAGHSVRMPRTDFGVWQLSYKIPHIPFFARGNYAAKIVAMNTAGATAERDMSISLR